MIMLSKLEKIMEKNEFKKMMKKENKAFKNYYVYEMILILLLAIIVIPNIILTINNMIPFNITIINTLLIIIVALPFIVLDIKNDLDIKNMHQYYLKEKKIPEYKVKTKNLNVCLIISIAVLIIWAIITIPNITKTENLSEIENTLVITTNNGNNIETQYEMFDGFKIKIPSEFKIMSDEFVNVKYSNRNAPSLIFNSFVSIFNINKAPLHNKKTNYF